MERKLSEANTCGIDFYRGKKTIYILNAKNTLQCFSQQSKRRKRNGRRKKRCIMVASETFLEATNIKIKCKKEVAR